MPRSILAVALMSLVPHAFGLQAPSQSPAQNPDQSRPQPGAQAPPASRLGVRAAIVKASIPVLPVVVLVEDDASYVQAIENWTLTARYPVLIDDGSTSARDDIARFVHAFAPERIVRWNVQQPWPGPINQRQERIEDAAFGAWDSTRDTITERRAELQFTPPGVVATDANDPAWTAGLAIAAARGLPIVWVRPPGNVNQSMSAADLDALEHTITDRCDELGLAWSGLGDAIDAIVLCANAPVRVKLPGDGHGALTDALGRTGSFAGSAPGASSPRWAWSGHLFGNKARAAYRAMAGLFITPDSAWLFDGYPNEGGFAAYDMTPAGDLLNSAGLAIMLDDEPRSGLRHWRARSSAPMDQDLALINTKGNRSWFDLNPGRGVNSDTPILGVPVWTHFTHSWSAVAPAARHTIAGTWIDRGAYAYIGSVEEPFLQAFVPPQALMARLMGARMPVGAASRPDGSSPVWRIAVLADPLLTMSASGPRAEGDLPLENTSTLDDEMREALKDKRFADGIRALVMLGRTADAVRLGKALLDDPERGLDIQTCIELAPAAFREASLDLLVACARGVPPAQCAKEGITDMLWQAISPRLTVRPPTDALAVMGDRLRRGSIGRDAKEIAQSLEKFEGITARSRFVRKAIENAPSEDAKKELLRSVGG